MDMDIVRPAMEDCVAARPWHYGHDVSIISHMRFNSFYDDTDVLRATIVRPDRRLLREWAVSCLPWISNPGNHSFSPGRSVCVRVILTPEAQWSQRQFSVKLFDRDQCDVDLVNAEPEDTDAQTWCAVWKQSVTEFLLLAIRDAQPLHVLMRMLRREIAMWSDLLTLHLAQTAGLSIAPISDGKREWLQVTEAHVQSQFLLLARLPDARIFQIQPNLVLALLQR